MHAKLDAKELANKITFNVEIKIERYGQWIFRLWIAKQLLRLAAFIAWANIEVNVEGSKE